jgi:hypothetical protein
MEEALIGLFWGLVFGTPVGWFLRSAAQWRREAKRLTQPIQVVAPQEHRPTQPVEARVERALDRLNQRLETMEDRLDFAERMLDTRSGTRKADAQIQPVRESLPPR